MTVIKAWNADSAIIEHWVRYLEQHAMLGVGICVVRWTHAPVSIGEKTLEHVMSQMCVGAAMQVEKVRAIEEKIVQQELTAASPVPEITQPAELKSTSSSASS